MDADNRFTGVGSIMESLLTRTSMEIVRQYINSQPAAKTLELCKAMVRDIIVEIGSQPPPTMMVLEPVTDAAAGKTIRAAMEILVGHDSDADEDDTRFADLMMELENFRRKHSIGYDQRWGEEDV